MLDDTVRKLLPFLACLMLVLTAWTGVAKAMEPTGCAEMAQTHMTTPIAADCDMVPPDADHGYPHHHGGCHSHFVADVSATPTSLDRARATSSLAAELFLPLTGSTAAAALRPPQA